MYRNLHLYYLIIAPSVVLHSLKYLDHDAVRRLSSLQCTSIATGGINRGGEVLDNESETNKVQKGSI